MPRRRKPNPRDWEHEIVPALCYFCKGTGLKAFCRANGDDLVPCPLCRGEGLTLRHHGQVCRCPSCEVERARKQRSIG